MSIPYFKYKDIIKGIDIVWWCVISRARVHAFKGKEHFYNFLHVFVDTIIYSW